MATDAPLTNTLTAETIEACAHRGARLFRNNSGAVRVAYTTKDGKRKSRLVRYGVGPHGGGGGDLIGWVSAAVTPDMVGKTLARFVSLEIKTGSDRMTEAQKKWRKWVLDAGGISGEVRSVDEAVRLLEGL